MDSNILTSLAKRLNLTDLEPDEEKYILSKQEEEAAISFAIESDKKHMAWKLARAGFSQQEIESRLSKETWMDEEKRARVLKQANSNRLYYIWQKEQREKEKADEQRKEAELKEKYSAKRMFGLMKWASENNFGKPLIVTEDNLKLIKALCYFISGDSRLESELGYSMGKGLLIRGISGLGKTHLVRCLEDNEWLPILVLSMIEVSDAVAKDGEFNIQLGDRKLIYLDDVGTEEATVTYYGTKINWFKNFVEMYYLRHRSYNRLMISTNNSFAEIEEKYGFRVRSRMKDMFNIVDITGKDMRG